MAAKCFSVSDARKLSGLRFCLYDGDPEEHSLWILGGDDIWRQAEAAVDGSYLVAQLQQGDHAVALVQEEGFPWIYVIAGGAFLMIILIVLLRKRKK